MSHSSSLNDSSDFLFDLRRPTTIISKAIIMVATTTTATTTRIVEMLDSLDALRIEDSGTTLAFDASWLVWVVLVAGVEDAVMLEVAVSDVVVTNVVVEVEIAVDRSG